MNMYILPSSPLNQVAFHLTRPLLRAAIKQREDPDGAPVVEGACLPA